MRLVKLILWGPVALLGAFVPLFLLNALQLLSVVILPFSRAAFHRANLALAHCVWAWWAFGLETLVRTKVTIAGDPLPDGESAIVVANHQAMGDVLALIFLALAKGRARDARWMVKDSMKWLPGLGWGILSLDYLLLKRDWDRDRETVLATFARYRESARPLWLVLFPEGTRRTPAKHAESAAYAKSAGLAMTERVMVPRTRGFTASLQGLRGKITAVYVVTIDYHGPAPSLFALMLGDVERITLTVERHPVEALPQDGAAAGAWLHDAFRRMDGTLRQAR